MRLIDADAVPKEFWDYEFDGKWRGCTIKDLLDSQPTIEPEQRWIPVSERLPKNIENSYWICTDDGYQCQCRWTNDVFGLGAGNKWDWKLFDIPQYSTVVVWMPLPESYRG